MDYSLSRKMVSRHPAHTPHRNVRSSWVLVTTISVLLAVWMFFTYSQVLQQGTALSLPPVPVQASAVDGRMAFRSDTAAPAASPGISSSWIPAHLQAEDPVIHQPVVSQAAPAAEITVSSQDGQVGITYSYSRQAGSPAVPQAAAGTTLSDLDFLQPQISGQQYLWNGATRQVLYHIGSSRLGVSLTMDLPAAGGNTPGLLRMQMTMDPAPVAPAYPRNVILLPMEDDFHSQLYETHLPNACGPAAALIVLDYFELEDSLNEVIRQMRTPDPAEGGYDPACKANPVCTSPMTIAHIFADSYGLIVQTRSHWSLEDVHQALGRGNPVVADIRWFQMGGTLGHFVVIYGIDMETGTLTYHDPFTGASRTAAWEQFSQRWTGPVDVNDPLQPEGFSMWGMEIYPPPSS